MSSENMSSNDSKKQKNEKSSTKASNVEFSNLPTVEETPSCASSVELPMEKHGEPIPNQESIIGLEWLNLGGVSSSNVVVESISSTAQYAKNLRIQLYQPPTPITAIIEESKYGILAPTSHQVSVVEPKIEVLSPSTHHAMVEVAPMGILKAADGTEIIVLSDDEDFPPKDNNETYESADEVIETETNIDLPILLSAIDSHCCARRMRANIERETQTPVEKLAAKRQRTRVSIAQASGTKSAGCLSTYLHSSDCASSEAPQKPKTSTHGQNSFKQRQLDLHRLRITVEQKRLELLELKLTRERDEMLREAILFEKELEFKKVQMRKLTEDCINV